MRLWRAWVALMDRREPATAQALVRIALGLCIVFDLAQIGALGLVDAVWAPSPHGLGYGMARGGWLVDWLGATPRTAELVWLVALVAGIAFTVGAGTRVAAAAFVLASAQLASFAPDCDRGIDMILRVVMAIMVFAWGQARWSVDAWLWRRLGRPYPALVPAWPRYLLLAQVIWIYFSSAHNKSGAEWYPRGDFAALINVLSDPHVARFSPEWVPHAAPLLRLATLATMVFEWSAVLVLWLLHLEARSPSARTRRAATVLRWAWIALGVMLHVGIAVFMNLGIFPFGMLALYPVLFRPDELHAPFRRRTVASA